tara:strand:+ start:210 stop:356 length:147 start_codon:yes stop_codon:yes gene_type:complete
MNNSGQFKPGNKAANKPKICPYCNKELLIQNYTYIKKKSNNTEIKRIK